MLTKKCLKKGDLNIFTKSKQFKKALASESKAKEGLFDEANRRSNVS
jgi:hypothetical protein